MGAPTIWVPPGAAAASGFVPGDHGYLGWSFDPAEGGTTTLLTANTGLEYVVRVPIQTPGLISTIDLFMTAVAVTPVAGQSLLGVYSTAGVQLGVTADLGTLFTGSTGRLQCPITTPFQQGAGAVYVLVLNNAATGVTLARRGASTSQPLVNVNLANAGSRNATNGSGTALPASITMSALTQVGNALFWCGAR